MVPGMGQEERQPLESYASGGGYQWAALLRVTDVLRLAGT
jgi:hypothetical protein